MKKHILLLLLAFIGFASICWAQVPQAIPYQGVARNAAGSILGLQAIGLRISLREGTAAGTVVYSETHNPTTTALGLFTVNIGQGTPVTGTLPGVNWGSGAKFIQVEMDVAGGTAYADMGTTQLNSVPYALFSGSSASLPDGAAAGNTLRWNGTAWVADNALTNNGTNVGVGTATPNASAIIDASSTTKGFLMPRMTTAQRDAIADPAVGLQIFNLDDHCTDLFDGSNWIKTCGLKVTGPATDSAHPTPNSWAKMANNPGGSRFGAVGFSIGSKGYMGLGVYLQFFSQKRDFWEYDPATYVWTQKADFGGYGRPNAIGFSIGSKGYAGTGFGLMDFWEYDPVTNAWTKKADFGGGGRILAVGFSIGSKGYVGTGEGNGAKKKDFWEYNPATDAWIQKADFGGEARVSAVGFSNGSKGFIGTGEGNGGWKNDFWEYDPVTDTWAQKADFGGGVRKQAVGFSIGSKGYIGTGQGSGGWKSDFWEYEPATDTWTQKADFGGGARIYAVGFPIGNKGYIGTGGIPAGGDTNDFWEYMDNNIAGTAYSSNAVSSPGNSITDGAWTLANGTVYNANNGNVGIGTSSPSAKLDIKGNLRASTTITAGGLSTAGIVTNTAAGLLGTIPIVPVANGGTGASVLTGYIKGNGTGAMTASSTIPGSDISGNISGNASTATIATNAINMVGTGSTTNAVDLATTEVSGTLPVTNGGTGAPALTGYIKGNGTAAMTSSATIPGSDISGNISGNAATSTLATNALNMVGAGSTTNAVDLATTEVSGTLPLGNGGTGTSTVFTTGSIPFAGAGGVYSQNNANLFWDNNNARLGIGTTSPATPLHVSGTGVTTSSMARTYFQLNNGSLVSNTNTLLNVMIRADGWIWSSGGAFVATSDKRIKNKLGISDNLKDLQALNKIEITDYKYIDEIAQGGKLHKKVIAQQLNSVYPLAVDTTKGIVPNVYETAKFSKVSNGKTVIETHKAHDFKTGDEVKLILERSGEKMVTVTVMDAHTFSVNEAINDKVFVYGKKINDLLIVDYDALTTLNISATQQLARDLAAVKKELERQKNEYEARLKALEDKLNKVLGTVTSNQ